MREVVPFHLTILKLTVKRGFFLVYILHTLESRSKRHTMHSTQSGKYRLVQDLPKSTVVTSVYVSTQPPVPFLCGRLRPRSDVLGK